MIIQHKSNFKKAGNGFGFVEVMVALSVLAALILGFIMYSGSSRRGAKDLSALTDCGVLADSIIQNIKSMDNALIIRSWLPTNASLAVAAPLPVLVGPADPLCNSVRSTNICDTLDHYSLTGVTLQNDSFFNSQNLRSSMTWAQSLYNSNLPAICQDAAGSDNDGIGLTQNQLADILPDPSDMPDWVLGARLFIRPIDGSCAGGSLSRQKVNSGQPLIVRVVVQYLRTPAIGSEASCASETTVSYPSDSKAPDLSVLLENGSGTLVPNLPPASIPACTCRRNFASVQATGGCPEMNDVTLELGTTEPGTLLLCHREGPSVDRDMPATNYYSCGDVQFSPAVVPTFTPDVKTGVQMNQGLQTRMRFQSLQARGNDYYQLDFRNRDMGGNEITSSARFRVMSAACPVPVANYCPAATATGVGIMFRPRDTCDIDLCPPGARTGQNCVPNPAFVCAGSFATDDCGNPTCPGTMVGTGCTNPTTFCGAPIPATDSCGGACPVGTNCITPCTCPDPATQACGTYYDDSCSNANACGPGTMGCAGPTPTPTPTPVPTPTPTPSAACTTPGLIVSGSMSCGAGCTTTIECTDTFVAEATGCCEVGYGGCREDCQTGVRCRSGPHPTDSSCTVCPTAGFNSVYWRCN